MESKIIQELAYGFLRDFRHALTTFLGVSIILVTLILLGLIIYVSIVVVVYLLNVNWIFGSIVACVYLMILLYYAYDNLNKLGD